ncbi:MAG: chorismate mutase [Nitrospirota bacterium]
MDKIQNLRKNINEIDTKISDLLKERLNSVKKIGEIKKSQNLPVIDSDREKEILFSLDTDYEKEIFKIILSASRKHQA